MFKLAKEARSDSLYVLQDKIENTNLNNILFKIHNMIEEKCKEGLFELIITNNIFEELFSKENEERFDDELILYVIHFLDSNGYTIDYDEFIYGSKSNYIEINW